MKKILYIGNKLSGRTTNQTTIDTLGSLLQKEGFTVFYASSKRNKVSRLLDMMVTTFQLRSTIDLILIDVYSTSNFWYAVTVSQMARFFKLPYIPILHGGNLPQRLEKSRKWSALLFNHAKINCAPSRYLLHEFQKKGYQNVCFLPNVLELDKYDFKDRVSFSPKLLWVRAFAAIYNPILAVHVFKKIKANYPEATLCMVGPDVDGTLQKVKDYVLQEQLTVQFTGKLSKKEWTEKAIDFDIFLNTTHFDNTPVSVMEAMALGLPIISTNVGGIPYLIKNNETAYLVDDNDATAMIQAIEKIVTNPEKTIQIVHNARNSVENMDWNVIKSKWLQLINE